MNTREAFLKLNAWAADFKAGVLPDSVVMTTLAALLEGLEIEDKETVMREALNAWWIGDE